MRQGIQLHFWRSSRELHFLGIAILILAINSSATIHYGATVYNNEICTESGYFEHPVDCSQYYRCVEDTNELNGTLIKYQFECPPGLIFDKNISSCNRESDVEPKPDCFLNAPPPPVGESNYPHKFSIIGSKYGLVNFKYNQSGNESESIKDIESVEIENVLVDPETLINFLSQTVKLKSLILRNVEFTSNIEDTVHLPLLEEFYLSHVRLIKLPFYPEDKLNDSNSKLIREFKTIPKSFKSLIFFYKNNDWNWKLENITQFKTNIEVVIHSVQLFKLNWRQNQLDSQLEFTDDIIANWDPAGPPLERFVLWNCSLNVPTVPTTLKMIDFSDVKYVNGSFSNVLRMNKGLKYIRGALTGAPLPNVYLSDIPKKIEALYISQGHIVRSRPLLDTGFTGLFELHAEFLHLNHLRFDACLIDEDIVRDFSAIFKSRSVIIVFPVGQKSETHSLLKEILKGSVDRLNLIGMNNFVRDPMPTPSSFEEIEQFLNKTGVPDGQRNFVLEKKDGDWRVYSGANRFGRI